MKEVVDIRVRNYFVHSKYFCTWTLFI